MRGVLGHGSAAGGATSGAAKYEWLGGESLKCDVAGCGAKHSETRLSNTLTLAIRKQQKAYYTGGLQCDENSCAMPLRKLPCCLVDLPGQATFHLRYFGAAVSARCIQKYSGYSA